VCDDVVFLMLWLAIAYWCERPEIFAAISAGKTPEDRSIAVLKWFIVRDPRLLLDKHSAPCRVL
jgi:hypothetical protein